MKKKKSKEVRTAAVSLAGNLDLTKLAPAPWYFVNPFGGELDTLVYSENDEDVPVLASSTFGSDTNWDFIALARSAFAGDPEAIAWWEANRNK